MRIVRGAARSLAIAALYGSALTGLLAVTLLLLQVPVAAGFRDIWSGAFGDAAGGHLYSVSETLVKTAPLLLAGLSIVVAWQAGLFSIGAEGQIVMGAIAATAAARLLASAPGPIVTAAGLLLGTAAGAFWAAIAGWLRVWRGVQEVISTIMLNYVALYLLGWLVQGPLQERAGHLPQSDPIPDAALFARVIPAAWAGGVVPRLHSGVALAFLAVPLTSVWLYRTLPGFQMRVIGANPAIARVVRYPVDRLRVAAMAVSGGLCGLAGAIELLGVTGRLYTSFSPGWGYTAIPVALLGGLRPAGTLVSALFFGALTAGTANLARLSGVSAVLINVIQAAAVLAVVGARAWRARRSGAGDE